MPTMYNHTIEELEALFEYNEEDGWLYWKKPHRFAGKRAGSILKGNGGYVYICRSHKGKIVNMLAHRVIMALHLGKVLPRGKVIDHINHNTADNRITNLRLTTPKQNSRNRDPKKLQSYRYVRTVSEGVFLDKEKDIFVVLDKEKVVFKANTYEKAVKAREVYEKKVKPLNMASI
jgi:hypothetical protein